MEFLGGRGQRAGAGDGDEYPQADGVEHLIDATHAGIWREYIDTVYGFRDISLLDLSMQVGSGWSA
ncbi:hypothetical protein Hesp01_63670 [Herbidospora sp. NBRC 101105]|nr:hypothetical protein Hesp01_63670 [Herbidospora sp. NBRC 101105]